MTDTNWLCYAAKRARECRSNYVVILHGKQTVEGTSFQQTLCNVPEPKGLTVYCFLEPGPEDLLAAEAAGIRAVYYAISKHDAARFAHNVKAQTIRGAREWVLQNHVAKWSANDPSVSQNTDPEPERQDTTRQALSSVQGDTQG